MFTDTAVTVRVTKKELGSFISDHCSVTITLDKNSILSKTILAGITNSWTWMH